MSATIGFLIGLVVGIALTAIVAFALYLRWLVDNFSLTQEIRARKNAR